MATALANVDMGSIMAEYQACIPLVLPTIIAFIGLRKGVGFVIGSLRRA